MKISPKAYKLSKYSQNCAKYKKETLKILPN